MNEIEKLFTFVVGNLLFIIYFLFVLTLLSMGARATIAKLKQQKSNYQLWLLGSLGCIGYAFVWLSQEFSSAWVSFLLSIERPLVTALTIASLLVLGCLMFLIFITRTMQNSEDTRLQTNKNKALSILWSHIYMLILIGFCLGFLHNIEYAFGFGGPQTFFETFHPYLFIPFFSLIIIVQHLFFFDEELMSRAKIAN